MRIHAANNNMCAFRVLQLLAAQHVASQTIDVEQPVQTSIIVQYPYAQLLLLIGDDGDALKGGELRQSAPPANVVGNRIFINEGCRRTIVERYGVAQQHMPALQHIHSKPNRVVGSVVLYGYFYIDAASLAVADLVCLDVESLSLAIADGYKCVWVVGNPDLFTLAPSSRSLGRKRGTVTWSNTNAAPKKKFSHLAYNVRTECTPAKSTRSNRSWKFDHDFQRHVTRALCRVYPGTCPG